MRELARLGFTGGKDSWPVDVPPEPGTVPVDAGGGQTVWIRSEAYVDEDGQLRAEVRDRPMRTDLAILGALAALEGGEPDPERLWADYERVRGHEPEHTGAFVPVSVESERALLLAEALLEYRDPDAFAALSGRERRERVVSIAKRIGKVKKILRELAADLEAGTVRPAVEDAHRDVLAAELRDLKGWSWVKIGQHLRIPQTDTDKIKNDNQRARKAAVRGRKLLKKASV